MPDTGNPGNKETNMKNGQNSKKRGIFVEL